MESVFQQALAHHRAGRLDEAEPLYRQAAAWKPEWALGNLGALLRATGRLDEAEAVLRDALAADPPNVAVRHTLGMTLLQLGRYAEGWLFYEARFEINPPPGPPHIPRWQGQPLRGLRLLVVAEQGLGDQILFARFVPLVAQGGRWAASEVRIAAPRPLVRLFAQLPAQAFHPGETGWAGVRADFWTPMGSIPRWLAAGPADAPPGPLFSPPPQVHAETPTQPAGIGLMLDGARANPNPLRLPPPPIAAALRGLAHFTDLDPAASGAPDLHATAQIIAGLERVVTVDTSVAHLAAALGKPTHILLPRPAVDWYANWQDDRTPWHPTARTIRQRTSGDWAGVLADVAAVVAGAMTRS